jgi:hypothetical protein
MAFRTPQAPYDIVQPRIPPGERRKGAGIAAADVAAGALEDNQILTESVGQLFDFWIAHVDTVHKHSINANSADFLHPGARRREQAAATLRRSGRITRSSTTGD